MTDWDGANMLPQVRLNSNYLEAVSVAKGLPTVLAPALGPSEFINDPAAAYASLADDCVSRIQGLILTGGGDLTEYKEKPPSLPDSIFDMDKSRDIWELALLASAERMGRPIFGICRGLQVMNRYFGGTLYLDIESEVEGAIRHAQETDRTNTSHAVALEKDSMIADILKSTDIMVNSGHHQAPKEPGRAFRVTGLAPDGVIESMEHTGLPFALGVQWHPEGLLGTRKEALALFEAFVAAAAGTGL
jgi:putative glutamine amidotransferase